ncbi:MAG: transglycosylase domain-containing protein [Nitrospinae bacterium]|nr:transglycosylase domain-containing protein [Nitrospinota bacterium]
MNLPLPAFFRRRPYFSIILFVMAALSGAVSGFTAAMYHDLPEIMELKDRKADVVTKILAADGSPAGEIYREKRIWIPYSAIPKTLAEAIVATEDSAFFRHHGIRYMSVARALYVDIREGRKAQGGSTITQQLAKTLFLTSEKSVIRKIKEALLAIQIEKQYAKAEILELYVNMVFLGSGSYGFEAAAMTYFGRPAARLSLGESAMLAGLLRAPSEYSPHVNYDAAVKRRAVALGRMRDEGLITPAMESAANAEPLKIVPLKSPGGLAPYFIDEVKVYLEQTYGADIVYRGGLTVKTSLSPALQKTAQEAMAAAASQKSRKAPPMEGAIAAIRPEDGAILAMVGGIDYKSSPQNLATHAAGAAGSAISPFIYLAAIESGFTPADMLEGDEGPVTLRAALENSNNAATTKLLDKAGANAVVELMERLGFHAPADPEEVTAGKVSPMEIASACAALADNGLKVEPYYISRAATSEGSTLEERQPRIADAVKPQAVYLLTDMLTGAAGHGAFKRIPELGANIAAFGGSAPDGGEWFAGFTRDIAVAVWTRNGQSGSAGAIWTKFMAEALKTVPAREFERPAGLVERVIDLETGKLATPLCPHAATEVFIAGTEPMETCPAAHKENTQKENR